MTNQTKAALAYVFGFISGIVFLMLDKEDEFIRKSAAQSTVFSLIGLIASILLKIIPIIGNILSSIVIMLFFIAWIVLIIKATHNIYLKLPGISHISEKYVLNQFTKNSR